MATLPVIRPDLTIATSTELWTWSRSGGSWTVLGNAPGYTSISSPVTSAEADGDTGIGLTTGANISRTFTARLANTPTDFTSMDTLSVRYSTTLAGTTYSDDMGQLRYVITNAAGTVALASFSSGTLTPSCGMDWFSTGTNWATNTTGDGSATAPAYNKVVTPTYVNTSATKADWDSAVITFEFTDTRNMGSDSATIVLVDFQLEGTYTPSGPPPATTVTPVKSTSASSSDVANVIPIYLPMTVNPVKSTSASSSDPTQLTVSWQPTTITPVKSTSTSSSDTAQLTATWLPTTVNPVKSTSASSTDPTQLTVTWLPTTVTPVKSTSASSSDQAQLTVVDPPTTIIPVGAASLSASGTVQLTSPGTPLGVTNLAGTAGASGAVALTWSAPVGVQ